MPDRARPEESTRKPKLAFGRAHAISAAPVAADLIRIDGVVEGEVRGTVVMINPNASIKGTIYAETVAVAGSLEGRILAATIIVTKRGA